MRELRLSSTGGFRKSAKISGDVMGNYHPHGEAAIYDAMARLAQDFAVRYPLVDGQGILAILMAIIPQRADILKRA